MGKNIYKKNGPEKITYEGKIIQVVEQPMKLEGTGKELIFEKARRSPGVRIIFYKDGKILLTKEYREEIESYDFRLPGGKVFDSLDEYKENIEVGDILSHGVEAVKRESREEVGLIPLDIEYFTTAKSGATIIWDLLYFVVGNFKENEVGQELEDGEDIEFKWFTVNEIKTIIADNKFNEARSVGVLFMWMLQNKLV